MGKRHTPALPLIGEKDELNISVPLPRDAEMTLEHVLNIMPQLIHWLIKSGVGYPEFVAALKPIFYNEAIKELEYIQQKRTDSSISLLSGLTRRDVKDFKEFKNEYSVLENYVTNMPISVPSRVVGMWVNQKLPHKIPLVGKNNSFEYLVGLISSEKHPRSILLELMRLGIVLEEGEYAVLQTSSFTPSPIMNESKQLFTENISDHLACGLNNLLQMDNDFLEQAIFADELTIASISELNKLTLELWRQMSDKIIALALEKSKCDENLIDAKHRFRLGIYQFNQECK